MKKIKLPERLQGTDGVRGLVLRSDSARVKNLSPVEAYVEHGVITEEFAELYGYCLGKFLLNRKFLLSSDSIVVGWDPRDKEGMVVNPFIRGLSRAIKKIITIGIVPTPAAVIFMQYSGAKASVVLTASHNPPEQNGIKIFLAPLGMKLLPSDEAEFSRLIYKTDYSKVKRIKALASVTDMSREAIACFKGFLLSPQNSWIESPSLVSKYSISIDSSNGAYSGISEEIFKSAGFGRVTETAGDLTKPVNEGCGVTEIERKKEWMKENIKDNINDAPEIVHSIYSEAYKFKKEIKSGKTILSGVVFDGDGDRFMRLDYNPASDSIYLMSGDKNAALLCRYLSGRYFRGAKDKRDVLPVLNTIESDVKITSYAEALGFKNTVTGIGDKWILFYSICHFIKEILDNWKTLGLSEKEKKYISDYLVNVKNGKGMSAFHLSDVLNKSGVLFSGERNKRFAGLLYGKKIRFGLAYEESGHAITMGLLKTLDSAVLPVFTGNGIKAALNSFAADVAATAGKSQEKRLSMLRHPFEESYKKTFYVYYSDRKKFTHDSGLRMKLKQAAKAVLKGDATLFLNRISEERKAEEPDLIYYSLSDEKGRNCGALYIRNSGTEEKTQITVKCSKSISGKMCSAGENISHIAGILLKSLTQPNAIIQGKILNILYYGGLSEKELKNSMSPDEIRYFSRVIDDSVKKEGFISMGADGSAKLTEKGRRFIEESKLKTRTACVILAAGKGTRMKSPLPKVLHKLNRKPLLSYSIKLAKDCGIDPVVVVVGYKANMVKKEIGSNGISYAMQREQLGTGHAVMQSEKALKKFDGNVLILYGDVPLLSKKTIISFLNSHLSSGTELSILTADLLNPFGYGRIVRDSKGDFSRIVEEKDTTSSQKKIKEINSGIYCVRADTLFHLLKKLNDNNSQHEYYLTDIAGLLKKGGKNVNVVKTKNAFEIAGINSVEELKRIEKLSKE
ncbi:MAG: NTP transferase domain-containing protein [Candidatus Schekmanbacteria bacterium]|nr:NTP transferase domain-containing protein [Candidatus Schekmanbacteria bacterium]